MPPGRCKSLNRRADILHRVVDRQPRRHQPAGRVDVHVDFLLGVFGLKKQQLGGDQAGAVILDRAGDENHPLLQEAGIDVKSALAPGGLFDHHRHQSVLVDIRVGLAIGRLAIRGCDGVG